MTLFYKSIITTGGENMSSFLHSPNAGRHLGSSLESRYPSLLSDGRFVEEIMKICNTFDLNYCFSVLCENNCSPMNIV